MSSKERIVKLLKALEVEEKKMREQIAHINGQLTYNQRMQETINQQLREIADEEAKSSIPATPPITSTKSKKQK